MLFISCSCLLPPVMMIQQRIFVMLWGCRTCSTYVLCSFIRNLIIHRILCASFIMVLFCIFASYGCRHTSSHIRMTILPTRKQKVNKVCTRSTIIDLHATVSVTRNSRCAIYLAIRRFLPTTGSTQHVPFLSVICLAAYQDILEMLARITFLLVELYALRIVLSIESLFLHCLLLM